MGNPIKNKNKEQDGEAASNENITAPGMPTMPTGTSARRGKQGMLLAKQGAEAVTREMAKAYTHCQAFLNERSAAAMPTSLKVTAYGPL